MNKIDLVYNVGGFRKHKHDKINLNKSREPAQWTGAVFFQTVWLTKSPTHTEAAQTA